MRNVVFFSLSTNLAELLSLILAVSIIGIAPLLAVQIIWINLVTDTSVEIPLGLEPKFGDELQQPPRHPKVGLMYPGLFLIQRCRGSDAGLLLHSYLFLAART